MCKVGEVSTGIPRQMCGRHHVGGLLCLCRALGCSWVSLGGGDLREDSARVPRGSTKQGEKSAGVPREFRVGGRLVHLLSPSLLSKLRLFGAVGTRRGVILQRILGKQGL